MKNLIQAFVNFASIQVRPSEMPMTPKVVINRIENEFSKKAQSSLDKELPNHGLEYTVKLQKIIEKQLCDRKVKMLQMKRAWLVSDFSNIHVHVIFL